MQVPIGVVGKMPASCGPTDVYQTGGSFYGDWRLNHMVWERAPQLHTLTAVQLHTNWRPNCTQLTGVGARRAQHAERDLQEVTPTPLPLFNTTPTLPDPP